MVENIQETIIKYKAEKNMKYIALSATFAERAK